MSTETVNQQARQGWQWTDPLVLPSRSPTTASPLLRGFAVRGATTAPCSPARGQVEVCIDIDRELKGYLLSPISSTRKSTRSGVRRPSWRRGRRHRASRRLEIHGETREVKPRPLAQLGDLDGRERLGLSIEAGLDRREFGLNWNADLPGGGQALEYEVAINVELQFVPEAE
jgi:hypothetical protein